MRAAGTGLGQFTKPWLICPLVGATFAAAPPAALRRCRVPTHGCPPNRGDRGTRVGCPTPSTSGPARRVEIGAAAEDDVVARDEALCFGDRLRRLRPGGIVAPGIADRAGAEDPERTLGELRGVPAQESARFASPAAHVDGAAQHDGVVGADVLDLGRFDAVRAGRTRTDPRRSLRRSPRWTRAWSANDENAGHG
jgi:hypothetical protein